MDTDKIKVFGARVKVDGTGKLAELERAERASPYSFLYAYPLKTSFTGKNEIKSRSHRGTQDQLLRQPPANLQLPGFPAS